MSHSRPGVATTMSTPRSRAFSWGTFGAPPYKHWFQLEVQQLALYSEWYVLNLERGKPNKYRARDMCRSAELHNLCFDLSGELSGWSKNQNCGTHSRVIAQPLNANESWEEVSKGLAWTRLCNSYNIIALKSNWPRLRLDWSWIWEPSLE